MKNVTIFVSGSGTNAENIIKYFSNNQQVNIAAVICNKPLLGAEKRAYSLNVPVFVFNRELFYNSNQVINILEYLKTDLVVLAGFLWLVPQNILENYKGKIINIHPALLPKYGGKGMYGDNVHKAVVENKETESGITIHQVNENYDEGEIIFQARCSVLPTDTYADVAAKVHELEYAHFPQVIDEYLKTF